MNRANTLIYAIPLFLLASLGCQKKEGEEVFIAPQPSGMEDVLYSAKGLLAVVKSEETEIPKHWRLPAMIANRKPSPEAVNEALLSGEPSLLAALLKEHQKRFLLIERGEARKAGIMGAKFAAGEPIEGFEYFGLDRNFILLSIGHERPSLSREDISAAFEYSRNCLQNKGSLPPEEAALPLRQKFYTELSISMFEGGRRRNWAQAKCRSVAEALNIACRKMSDKNAEEKKSYDLANGALAIDFFYGHATFEDPDEKMLDEFIKPARFGISIKRYVPLKDGRYPNGFYYFMPPIIFNLREFKQGSALAKRLCSEVVGEDECYLERANLIRRFETLAYFQEAAKLAPVMLERGRVPISYDTLTPALVEERLKSLFDCALRFTDEKGEAALFINMSGKKAEKNLPPERLMHFYAPLLRAARLYGEGWPDKVEAKIAPLSQELKEKIYALADNYDALNTSYRLYSAKEAPYYDLIGGIIGDKWRGEESFSTARYWSYAQSFPHHTPPKADLEAMTKFIIHWQTTPQSVGFRLSPNGLKSLEGCVARSPSVLLSNPQDQSASAYILALWLKTATQE